MTIRYLLVSALMLALLLPINGCSDDPAAPTDAEPNVVDDLVAGLPDFRSVVLNWTAPQNALEYDLRYTDGTLDHTTWDAATRVTGVPDPGETGTIEICRVEGLVDYTAYDFGLKFRTGEDQWSALSNVAECYTSTFDSRDRIVFMSDAGGIDDLYMMYPDGTDLVRLTHSMDLEWSPRWSRDGSRLAFAMNDGPDEQIFLMDPVSGDLFQVTHEPLYCINPAFSPDDTRLAYRTGTGEPDGNDLVVIGTDGTGRRALIEDVNPALSNPDWSPDGSLIVFNADLATPNTSMDIYTIPYPVGTIVRLTTEGGSRPAWSPDGTRIAFSRWDASNSYIYVMNADGSNRTVITDEAVPYPDYPRWSPDGTRLVFQSGYGNDHDIWVVDADGGNLTQLTDNSSDERLPDWSWAQ